MRQKSQKEYDFIVEFCGEERSVIEIDACEIDIFEVNSESFETKLKFLIPALHVVHVTNMRNGLAFTEVNPHVLRREKTASHPLTFTKYEGSAQTDLYAKELRFSTSMFDDHMPWGYNSLFSGRYEMQKCTSGKIIGCILLGVGSLNQTNHRRMDLAPLESLVSNRNESGGLRESLKRNWRRIKDTTKDFFRNFG